MRNLCAAVIMVALMACGGSGSPDLDYRIVEREDTSYSGVKRYVYRVVLYVEEPPEDSLVKEVAEAIWRRHGRNYDEFTVFAYLPGMDTGSLAYGVSDWSNGRLERFVVNRVALIGTQWDDSKQKAEQGDEDWQKQKEQASAQEYSLNLDLQKTGPKKLKIAVTTNFPEGTNLLISVSREFFEKGSQETYSGELFDQDVPVRKDGSVLRTVGIDDSAWLSERRDNRKELPNLFPEIRKIADEITVRVLYSPRRKQPLHVSSVLGKNGENVKGEGAKQTGNFTTFSVEKKMTFPLQR